MRYPALIRAGSQVDEMVLNVDLAPTLLDVANVKWSDSMHGRSLVPLLKGERVGWRSSFLAEYFGERTGLRVPN